MAISFGRRGTGGDDGGANVIFLEDHQTSHADISNSTWTGLTLALPTWQIGGRATGKAEINFGIGVEMTWSSASSPDIDFQVRVQGQWSDSQNSGFNALTTLNLVDGQAIVYRDSRHLQSETSTRKNLSAVIPFSLSDLPAGATDGKYIRFRLEVNINSSSTPSRIRLDDSYMSFTAYGNGYGIPPDGSIQSFSLADGSVTRPKVANQAIDYTKIAPDSVRNDQLADNAVRSENLATWAVTQTKISQSAVGTSQLAQGAVTSSRLAQGAVGTDQIANESITNAKLHPNFGLPIPDNSITREKIVDSAVDGSKIESGSIGATQLGDAVVGHDQLADSSVYGSKIPDNSIGASKILDASIGNSELADNSITSSKIQNNTLTPEDLRGVGVHSAALAGYAITIDSEGTGFTATRGGAGGGIASVEVSDLEGVIGGSDEARKFIKTDSSGEGFVTEANITPGDIGLSTGATEAGKVVGLDSSGNALTSIAGLKPSNLGLHEGINEAGKLIGYDSTGRTFISVAASGTQANITLENITGLLNVGHGGTGIAATDLDDLRAKLGITGGASSATLTRSTNADTQQDSTINQVSSATASLPAGVGDGIIIRVGNDQWLINFADGKQWKRNLTDSNNGVWTEPVNATLPTLATEADFRTLTEGGRGVTTAAAWLPAYTDGSTPAKVIVGRNGDYLVAINRQNTWWAPRPTDSTWTSIPWRWEDSSGSIPHGLIYFGGEKDEELIPAGEDAVLGGKSGIDGEAYIDVMVDHQVANGVSTFTAYFLNDDADATPQTSTNTRGYTAGTWTRVQADVHGIDDNIIVQDGVSEHPVFLGDVPALDTITFDNYTLLLSGVPSLGDVLWTQDTRTIRVRANAEDPHLAQMLQVGFELELHKDTDNYIRGVIAVITPIAGEPGEFTATFRADDLITLGTIAQDDTISVIGRRSVLLKSDTIQPVNLGLSHGSANGSKIVALNSAGNAFEAVDDIGAIPDGSITSAKFAPGAVDSNAIGTGAVGSAAVVNGAIGSSKVANGAIQPVKLTGLSNSSANAGRSVVINSEGNGFEAIEITGGGGGASDFSELTGIAATTQGGTGINASDLTDLRDKLGIGTDAGTSYDTLPYTANANQQKNNTLHRVDASTGGLPTGVADGLIARTGNDQWLLNIADGKQWKRTLSNTGTGVWSTPVDLSPVPRRLTSAINFVTLEDGGIAYTDAADFLPSFTNGSKPSKVIISRKNEYLLAIDRYNAWWSERITDISLTSIPWQWAANSTPPAGLIYSGGEADEEYIPAGESAVLAGRSGVDGTAGISVLVNHSINAAGTTSTYTAYFVNDDNADTIQSATNTRGYTIGNWSRVRVDLNGISTDIFVPDTDEEGNVRPAFVGVVPAIENVHFGGYTLKASASGMVAGDVFYNSSSRTLYVIHKTEDLHLDTLFAIDYEVSLYKDSSNFVRGVFAAVANIPPIGNSPAITGAQMREDDIQVVGTLSAGDTVEIRGHKAVITKTDTIRPVNLGINHSEAAQNKAVLINATGDAFTTGDPGVADGSIGTSQLANDAVTPAKISGVDTGSTEAGKALILDSTGNNWTTGNVSGTPAAGSITHAMLGEDIIEADNIKDGAIVHAALAADCVEGDNISDDSIGSEHIKNSAITHAMLSADCVDGDNISDDSIGSEHIKSSAILTAAISSGAITSNKIFAGAVGQDQLAANSVTPTEIAGITPGASIGGHYLTLNADGDGITTSAGTGGGGTNDANGQVYLAEANATDLTNSYGSTGNKTENETLYSRAFKLFGKSNGGAVWYYHATLRHGSTHSQDVSAKLQVRWAASAAAVASATNWADASVFNGTATFLSETITGNERNIDQDHSLALPFQLADLPSGAADNQYLQFRVVYTFTANSADNTTPVVWTRKGRRYYGVGLTGGNGSIPDNTITNAMLQDDSVGSENLAASAVDTTALANSSITPAKIANITTGSGSVSKVLALDATNGTEFTLVDQSSGGGGLPGAGQITHAMLGADIVEDDNIADDQIGSEHIKDGAILHAALGSDCVESDNIADDAIGSEHLQNDSVGNSALADDSVGQAQLQDDSVGASQLIDDSVGADALASGSVGTAALAAGAVTAAKVGSGAITSAKVGSGAIGTSALGSQAVTQAKIANSAVGGNQIAANAIDPSKVSGVTAANNANKVVAINSTADGFTLVDQSSGGGLPGAGEITHAMLGADIVESDNLADDSVGSEHLQDDSVLAAAIATGAVGSDALAADAVGASAIADGAIGTSALASSAVTPAKVSGVTTGASNANKVLALDSAGTAFVLADQASGGGGGGGSGTGSEQVQIKARQRDFHFSPTAISSNVLTLNESDYDALTTADTIRVVNSGGYTNLLRTDMFNIAISNAANHQVTLMRKNPRTGGPGSSVFTIGTGGTPTNVILAAGGSAVATDPFSADGVVSQPIIETAPWQLTGKSSKYYQVAFNTSLITTTNYRMGANLQVGYSSTEDGTYTWVNVPNQGNQMLAGTEILHWWGSNTQTDGDYPRVGIDRIFALSDLPSAISDNDYIKFRMQGLTVFSTTLLGVNSTGNAHGTYGATLNITILDDLGVQTIGGGSGSGGGGGSGTGQVQIRNDRAGIHFSPTAISGSTITLREADYNALVTGEMIRVIHSGGYTGGIPVNGITGWEVVNASNYQIQLRALNLTNGAFSGNAISPTGPGTATNVIFENGATPILKGTSGTYTYSNSVIQTDAWQLEGKSSKYYEIVLSAMTYSASVQWRMGGNLQVGYSSTENGSYTWVNVPMQGRVDVSGLNVMDWWGRPSSSEQTFASIASHRQYKLSNLPSAITDGDYIKFRMQYITIDGLNNPASPSVVYSELLDVTILDELGVQTIGGGSGGGGSSTPADDSITHAMLKSGIIEADNMAADSIVNAAIATGAVNSDSLAADSVTNAAVATGAINSDSLAADSVTNAAIATGAVNADSISNNAVTNSKVQNATLELNKLADIYSESSDYTFKGVNQSTLANGESTYVLDSSAGTGQIAARFVSADSAIETALGAASTNGEIVSLQKDADNFVMLRKTGSQSSGDALAITGTIVSVQGTIAANDTTKLLYGSATGLAGVVKSTSTGAFTTGAVEPLSMDIIPGSGKSNHIITLDNAGTGFNTTAPANVGLIKAVLGMRSNTGASGDGQTIDNVGNTRRTWTNAQNMQTGGWVLQHKAHDWLRVNAAGLYFLGFITEQPVVVDLELWVRWKGAGESYQDWGTTDGNINDQTRVKAVSLGGDRLQVTKLYAGGTGSQTAPVDMAVPSGTKFLKLSQLPSEVANGDEIQFTVGFSNQNGGPTYRVRNFFMTLEVMDAANTYFNY